MLSGNFVRQQKMLLRPDLMGLSYMVAPVTYWISFCGTHQIAETIATAVPSQTVPAFLLKSRQQYLMCWEQIVLAIASAQI